MERPDKEYLEKDIKKHKPNLLTPIINTILGIAFIVLMIRVTIYNDINPIYLVLVILLMLIFIGGSWYTSFFFKKKNRELTKDFEKETKLLFDAVYELKKGTYIEPKNPVKFDIINEYGDIQKVSYDLEKREFIPKIEYQIFVNLGTTCAGLVVDYTTLEIIGFHGMSPYSIWMKKRVVMPDASKGNIKLNMDGFNKVKKLTLKIMNQADTYYDKKSGNLAIGDMKKTSLDENIQIGDNIIVSLYDNEIKCIYIKLQENLFDK
ncbi:MAG: hypothetical protein IKC22_00150 [Bacilli bacterium]|nr:hypothetical protein [Bacilli bacterium]